MLADLQRRFPNEPEYLQAVEEVITTIEDEYNKHPEFERYNLIERLCIRRPHILVPRILGRRQGARYRTTWAIVSSTTTPLGRTRDEGSGFHSSVNQSILKFLAFEQTF